MRGCVSQGLRSKVYDRKATACIWWEGGSGEILAEKLYKRQAHLDKPVKKDIKTSPYDILFFLRRASPASFSVKVLCSGSQRVLREIGSSRERLGFKNHNKCY